MSLNCDHKWPIVYPQVIYEYGEPWWNYTDRGKPQIFEINVFQCHFVHNKSHMD
jgi:hypothetical protein